MSHSRAVSQQPLSGISFVHQYNSTFTSADRLTPSRCVVLQWFLEGGALPRLMGLAADDDSTCRSKAVLALSGLLRHFLPGVAAFRQQGGLQLLVGLLASADSRLQRKVRFTAVAHASACAFWCGWLWTRQQHSPFHAGCGHGGQGGFSSAVR
jgi:hypothetical protein